MARDVLSIPLTSVSVERVFSSARDVIPYHRNRLSPIMIEQLLVAKCWLRKRIPKEKVQIDVNDEFANIENNMEVEIIDIELADIDPIDTEFLQRMVPQECSADSTRETDLDSDMDYQTDC